MAVRIHLIICIMFAVALCASLDVKGQGWEKLYGTQTDNWGNDVKQTKDGGYIIVGQGFNLGTGNIYVVKTDANGDSLWTKNLYGLGEIWTGWFSAGLLLDNGGYLLYGISRPDSMPNDSMDDYLIEIDSDGEVIWEQGYKNGIRDREGSVIQCRDKGFAVVGSHQPLASSLGLWEVSLLKTDSVGNQVWAREYGDSSGFGHKIIQTSDGGYLIGGGTTSSISSTNYLLIKTDALGNEMWRREYGTSLNEDLKDIEPTSDGGYVLLGEAAGLSPVVKIDSLGNVIWTKWLSEGVSEAEPTSDGGYILIHDIYYGTHHNVLLTKMDQNWDSVWARTFGGSRDAYGYSVEQTTDNGYIISGWIFDDKNPGTYDYVYLIKTDSLGFAASNVISGKVFNDMDFNCAADTAEIVLQNLLIKTEPGPYYTTTDAQGNYSTLVYPGTHTVSVVPAFDYWQQVCPNPNNSYSVNFASTYDTSSSNDFAFQINDDCPFLTVDIATWGLHRCDLSGYTVRYCNPTIYDIDDVVVVLTLTDEIAPYGSSQIPWALIGDNQYSFNIGTVGAQECGSFYFKTLVSCDIVIGSTHCAMAHIYPDSICAPLDPNWDKSSVSVTGICQDDSLVCFKIYNTGEDMLNSSQYRIYENNIWSGTGNFQLMAGDSVEYCVTANGNTFRLEADQLPGHPGKSHPRAHVESCGNVTPVISGMITKAPQDDLDLFIDCDCTVIKSSYDPNEKLVKPEGGGVNHFIDSTDALDYQINFQNTGNDTAFKVVLRDTLSGYLDLASIQLGAGSHAYTFRIYGKRILEWTFADIYLPDSNINEPLSHGFVKFKIQQKAGNVVGTVIENRAAIYFDYNEPVITNTTFNTIWKEVAVLSNAEIEKVEASVLIYPNPSDGKFIITNSMKFDAVVVYTLLGTKISEAQLSSTNSYTLDLGTQPDGLYIISLISDQEVFVQKLLKQ